MAEPTSLTRYLCERAAGAGAGAAGAGGAAGGAAAEADAAAASRARLFELNSLLHSASALAPDSARIRLFAHALSIRPPAANAAAANAAAADAPAADGAAAADGGAHDGDGDRVLAALLGLYGSTHALRRLYPSSGKVDSF